MSDEVIFLPYIFKGTTSSFHNTIEKLRLFYAEKEFCSLFALKKIIYFVVDYYSAE